MSTGASNLDEIKIAVKNIEDKGCSQIALLHCILNYPTLDIDANLKMISNLIDNFPNYIVGYSDHTLPNTTMTPLVTAVLLGAKIIEKHFTNNKGFKGNDHYHSMDVNDLKIFVSIVNQIENLVGTSKIKEPIKTESISRLNARRSIVLSKDILIGEVFSDKNLTYKRPGTGISPLKWDKVIGRKSLNNLKSDYMLKWDDISDE